MSKGACGLIAQGSFQIPLSGVDVSADIVGRGAKVKVSQTFINREQNPVEAVYKFPLPENSTVCGFRAKIGNREIQGIIEAREKAFEKYDDALMRGDGAYLLDEERPNIFTLSVGNVNAGMTAVIEIDYACLLDANGPEVRFFLPTTIAPRYIPKNIADENDIPADEKVNPDIALDVPYELKVAVNIHGKDGVATIESPSHRITTNIENSSIKIQFSSESVKMDRDFVLNILYKKEFESRAYLFSSGYGKFLQIDFAFSRPVQAEATDVKLEKYPKEIIFVLDCSGSMRGSSIDSAKKAISILIRGLDENSRFNIYRFGSLFVKLFESSAGYNAANVQKAIDYIENIDADMGGTELLGPLMDIYSLKVTDGDKKDIIIITDGEVGNETEVSNLAKNGRGQTRIFTVGIGHGPNEYLVKQMARTTYGSTEFIAPNERIEPKILRLFKKIKTDSLHDLKIELPGLFDQAHFSPDVQEGDTITMIGRLPSDTEVMSEVKISGLIDKARSQWILPVEVLDSSNMPVPLLWARQRVRDLEEGTSDELNSGSQQKERKGIDIRKRIMDISMEFGIISREASFIALETRTSKDNTNADAVLRRIPAMLTKEWGGTKKNMRLTTPRASGTMIFHRVRNFDIKPNPSSHVVSRACEAIKQFKPGSILKSAIKKSSHRSKEDLNISPEDMVLAILTLQRPAGGFDMNADVAHIIGTSLSKLREISKTIQLTGKGEKDILLNTALILALLHHKFATEKELWEAVVEKSENWLRIEVARLSPSYQGIELEKWAANYYG